MDKMRTHLIAIMKGLAIATGLSLMKQAVEEVLLSSTATRIQVRFE